MSEQQTTEGAPAQCRYMRAAYPDLDAEDTCSDHRHDAATFALARAFAVACQSDKPTDEQIGWMLDDAAAVVDDFDPLPTEWTVTEPQITDEPGLDFTLTVNDEPYVTQQSEWEPSHPVSLAQWRTWMRESGLAPKCLPCTGGTHRACTGWALDETADEVVDCGCVLHAVPDEE